MICRILLSRVPLLLQPLQGHPLLLLLQLAAGFPTMVLELKKKGVTLQWLWELYIQERPEGYQYSQYCLHFHRWRQGEEVVMHIDNKAGEEMFVDWAGDKLEVIDGNTGQPWKVEQFVAILGASA